MSSSSWREGVPPSAYPEVLPRMLAPRLLLAYGRHLEGPFHPTVRIPGVCISLVLEGTMDYRLPTGRTGTARSGEAVIHYPGLSGYDLGEGERFLRYAVYFQAGPDELADGVPALPGYGPVPETLDVRTELPSLLPLYERIFETMLALRPTWPLETSACLIEILRILFDIVLEQRPSRRNALSRWDRLLARIENASELPSVAELAETFHLGVEQFIREFTRHVGQTPKQYILTRRLWKARQRIQEGAMVKEAAFHTGFHSVAHFSRAYRKRFGCAPSDTPPPGDGIVPTAPERLPAQRHFWAPGVNGAMFAP